MFRLHCVIARTPTAVLRQQDVGGRSNLKRLFRFLRSLAMTLVGTFILTLPSLAKGEQTMTLTSPAFENNQDIPAQYTCAGADINPPLTIKNIPPKTESLALYVHDPDAAVGEWAHWVVYNIKPETQNIAENSIPGTELFNDFGKFHYGGPCPPAGKPHHYLFEMYALNRKLEIIEGGTIRDLQQAMKGHILAKSTLVGIYTKHSW